MEPFTNPQLPLPCAFPPYVEDEHKIQHPPVADEVDVAVAGKLMGGTSTTGGSAAGTSHATLLSPPLLVVCDDSEVMLHASGDSSPNGITRDLLDPHQQLLPQPPLFSQHTATQRSSQSSSSPIVKLHHQQPLLTTHNAMSNVMSVSGNNELNDAGMGGIRFIDNGSSMSSMVVDDMEDDASSRSLNMSMTTTLIGDEDVVAGVRNGAGREKEVSSVGGSGSSVGSNNKKAQRRAKRERRQRAKEGDVEIAFAAGSVDMSQSIAVGGSMREILIQGGGWTGSCGGSGHEWVGRLLSSGGSPQAHQRYSVDVNDDMLADLQNTKLMGGVATSSSPPTHQGDVVESMLSPSLSAAATATNVPKSNNKRNDLRSGKRNLMSSWCNNVHTQHQENKISSWIDHVPSTTALIATEVTDVHHQYASSSLAPREGNCPVYVVGDDTTNSTILEPLHLPPTTTTTTTAAVTDIYTTTSPCESTVTDGSSRSFVNGIRSIVESCRLAPTVSDHSEPDADNDDDKCITEDPLCYHRSGTTTPLLGNISELADTASYPLDKEEQEGWRNTEKDTNIQSAYFSSGLFLDTEGSNSGGGVGGNTNITPVPSSSSLSLGFISTQPIIRKPRKVNTESPTKRSAVAAVSLNDSVYNLHHWDENEYGWFVVPTDNVVMDVGGVSTSASPHEQRQPSSVSGGEVLRCSPDEVVPHRSPRLIVLPISDTVGDIHSIVAKFQGSHQNTKHATTTSTEKENFESCVTREDVESEEMATTTTTAAAIMSLFGITLPSVLSTDALAELDDALASVVIAAQPLLPAVDVVGRGVAVVGGGAGDDDGGATLRCNEVHFPPTSSPSSSATMSSSITAAIVRSGATLTTAAPTNHNNNTTTTNNSSSSMFSATDVLAAFFTPTLSPATGSSVSPLSGRGGMLSSLSAVAAGGPDRFGCMKPISARDSRFEGVNTNTDVHTPPLSPQMKLLGVGLGSSSSQLIRPNSANHYTNVTASNTSWQRQFRMSVSALQEQQLSSSGSCFNNNNKNSSSILLKSTRWGESGTVADGSITTDESIPSSPPRTVPSSTSMAWSVSFPTNNASPPNNNPNPPSPIPPSSPLRNRSHPMFSEIVSGYGVTVDTLTHGATNHTLQLAQPLTGDSARNYRRNEARMQPSPQHEQLSEQED